MNLEQIQATTSAFWEAHILPALHRFIEIENLSPVFDPDWAAHGHMDAAVDLAMAWSREHLAGVEGTRLEVLRLEGRTPVVFVEVEATPGAESVPPILLYGHLDKQPEMTGWAEDLGPWKPVRKGDRLYGRGGADDGYAIFACVSALLALKEQDLPHPRLVFVIECSEESGSPDLPAYIEAYADRLGSPGLVVCLDSGAGDYERLWLTTSLRGLVVGTLTVETIVEGVHSGRGSGIVPGTFRIARHLLSRIEDPETGEITLPGLFAEIPRQRTEQAAAAAEIVGDMVEGEMTWHEGVAPVSSDRTELLLNRTWRPALTITGADGLPSVAGGGNVMRPKTALKLSMRLPPTVDAAAAARLLEETLEADPPYGAKVRFEVDTPNPGWHAPALAPWLEAAIDGASRAFFGTPAGYQGEGGSIPFMGMLGESFPEAQFVITGVLGPGSNAHGPNEFLHIPMGKGLTAAVAKVIVDYHGHHTA